MVTVVAGVVLTILAGGVLARLLGLKNDLGLLTGGSVAICGASAAMAISSVLPQGSDSKRQTLFTVIGVTSLSTVAMVLYPVIGDVLHFDEQAMGIFVGATIHDVAQVVGAGYSVSPTTGDLGTFIKLLRVAMLVPVVMIFSWLYRASRNSEGKRQVPMLPGFLVGFVALVLINSLGLIPESVNEGLSTLSRWCLVTAIAALGIKTSFQKLAVVGWKPVILMVLETLLLLAIVLGVVVFGGLGS